MTIISGQNKFQNHFFIQDRHHENRASHNRLLDKLTRINVVIIHIFICLLDTMEFFPRDYLTYGILDGFNQSEIGVNIACT